MLARMSGWRQCHCLGSVLSGARSERSSRRRASAVSARTGVCLSPRPSQPKQGNVEGEDSLAAYIVLRLTFVFVSVSDF